MGPTWVLSAPDGPHAGPMNFAIRGIFVIVLLFCVASFMHTYLSKSYLKTLKEFYVPSVQYISKSMINNKHSNIHGYKLPCQLSA